MTDTRPREARSGLDPWARDELPAPPSTRGLKLLGVIGPGAIILGVSIGSGEWLLGPAAFVRYGLSLLWVTLVASFLQTVFNTELMRYTLYTGEPAFTGFMRTRPRASFWAVFYAALAFLQVGWPGWAGAAAGAIFYLGAGRLSGPGDEGAVYAIGAAAFGACVLVLLFGRRIERTLEILNWVLIVGILGGLTALCVAYASGPAWGAAAAGFAGYDAARGKFDFFPAGADWFLIGAFAAYSGAGGVINLILANWARDKGFGMGSKVGFIPAAVGGKKVALGHVGRVFDPAAPESAPRWRAWWRIVAIDQWGVFFTGALLGMALPAVLYVTFLPPGRDIRGLAVAAELASAMAARGGPALAFAVALMGAWVLFKTQLDILEGLTRAITDILWTGSSRVRAWRGGDVRVVYYAVLGVAVVFGLVALGFAQPILLLQLGANTAGIVFAVSAIHILVVNVTLLPPALRPPLWRRAALVAMAVFYGFFVALWLWSAVR